MPVGEYLLEDGRLVVVEEEGKIADVREVSDEVPAKEEESDDKEITEDLAEEEEKRRRNGRCCRLGGNGEKNPKPRRCDCRFKV